MTTRIYALAKDLNVESKALIDLCQQLGIKNKASALTILTDVDVEKINAHLAQQSQKINIDYTAPVAYAPAPPSPVEFGKVSRPTQKSKSCPEPKAPANPSESDSVLLNLTDDVVAKVKAHLKQLSSKKESYPIRIYLLSKEIGIESKVLLDLCQQLGIKCKGGTLTNLMKDDVAKIKAYFEQ